MRSPRWSCSLLLSLLLSSCGPAALPPSAPSQILAQPLPRFQRQTIDGRAISTREPTGKVVVVKFFAKYCDPCTRTLPAAERLHQRAQGVLLLGVAEDEYRDDVDQMVRRYGLTFPIIHDRGQVLAGRFRVTDLPATFVADTHGTIRWVGGPAQAEGDLETAVEWIQSQPQ
jgi:peroxiredoxin